MIQRDTKFKQKCTLYMNHLMVTYAFLLPISSRALSTIFSIILILFIVRGDYKYYLSKSISNKIVQAGILFFLVHIIWLLGTDNFSSAERILDDMKYLIYPVIFLSFLDKSFSFRVISAFILGMLTSEIISYLIYFNILPHTLDLFSFKVYKAQAINNPTPFLIHSRYNVLLSIVVSILLFNLLTNFRKNSKLVNIISILFICSASYNITIVGGRIGYISFLFLIFTTLFLAYRKKAIWVLIPATFLLVFFLYLSYEKEGMFTQRVNQTIDSTKKIFSEKPDLNSSIGYRITFWISSFDVIKDNLIFGVGTGDEMYETRLNEQDKNRKRVLNYLSHSHNEYLKDLLQFGLIGFVFFINLFYQIFRQKDTNEISINILFITTIGVLIGLTSSTFDSKIYLPLLMLMVSATTTKNSFLNYKNIEVSLKEVFYYITFILLFFIFAIVQ